MKKGTKKKALTLLTYLVLAISITLFVQHQHLTTPFLSEYDSLEKGPIYEKIADHTKYPNNQAISFFATGVHNSPLFVFLLTLLMQIFSIRTLELWILPFIISFIVYTYLEKSLSEFTIKKAQLKIISFALTLIYWTTTITWGLAERALALALMFPCIFYINKKKHNKLLFFSIITILIYPLTATIIIPYYIIRNLKIIRKKDIAIKNINSKKILTILILGIVFLISLHPFLTKERTNYDTASKLQEFKLAGPLPTFFENPTLGMFSPNDEITTRLYLFDKDGNLNPITSTRLLLFVGSLILLALIYVLNYNNDSSNKTNLKLFKRLIPFFTLQGIGMVLYFFTLTFAYKIPSYLPVRYLDFTLLISLLLLIGMLVLTLTQHRLLFLASLLLLILIPVNYHITRDYNYCEGQSTSEFQETIKFIESLDTARFGGLPLQGAVLTCIPHFTNQDVIHNRQLALTSMYFKSQINPTRETINNSINTYFSISDTTPKEYCTKYNLTHIIYPNKESRTLSEEGVSHFDEPYRTWFKKKTPTHHNKTHFKNPIFENKLHIIYPCK